MRSSSPSAGSPTRRTFLRSAMPIPLAFLAACGPGGGLPFLTKGTKVIRAAAFLGSDPGILTGGERSTVELQKAANTVNQLQLGFEIKVDFLTLPPRPTADPNPSASGAPTPTPFAATASALEQAFAGGADAAGGASGPPPDLALLTSAADLPILLERKLVAAVDEAARADSPVKWGDFVPGALEMVRSKGKLAAIPLSGNPAILLYDSALFGTGGVLKPDKGWTWNSLVEAGRRLTRVGSDQEIWGINAYGSLPLLLSLIWGQNGEVITKDGKKAQLSDPATREGIQMWADLILRHKIAPTPPSGGSVGLSLTPNEIGLTGIAPGGAPGAALGAGSVATFTQVVIGGPGGPGGSPDALTARPASRQRLAMAINASPVLPGLSSQPPTVLAADVPKGKRQATYQTLSAAMALTTRAADPKLALRAALALADQLLESPVAGIGYPVRKPDPGLLRRVQPRLSDEDAAVMANALTYARGLPPEVVAALPRILVNRLMDPIANGRASIEDAIRDASTALDDVLK